MLWHNSFIRFDCRGTPNETDTECVHFHLFIISLIHNFVFLKIFKFPAATAQAIKCWNLHEFKKDNQQFSPCHLKNYSPHEIKLQQSIIFYNYSFNVLPVTSAV